MGAIFKTTQNFIYNPISEYDDILLTYGKNMHSQRFVYGAKDKDKGLIKVDSYQLYGQLWDKNSTGRTYQDVADYHNDNYAKETFKRDAIISTYMIKDIRGSIEQQTGKKGYKGLTYQYTAFGVEKFPMNLNDMHGFAGYVRDRETDSYYANARQYLPEIHRFMAKDKLRVDSLNRYLYVMNNPVNFVDLSGLWDVYVQEYKNTMYVYVEYEDTITAIEKTACNAFPFDDVMSYYDSFNWVAGKVISVASSDLVDFYIYKPEKSFIDSLTDISVGPGFANDVAGAFKIYGKLSLKLSGKIGKTILKNAGWIITLVLSADNYSKHSDKAEQDSYLRGMIQETALKDELNKIKNPEDLYMAMLFLEGKLKEYGEYDYKKYDEFFGGCYYGISDYSSNRGITLLDKITNNESAKESEKEMYRKYFNGIADRLYEDYMETITPKDYVVYKNLEERYSIYFSPTTKTHYKRKSLVGGDYYEVIVEPTGFIKNRKYKEVGERIYKSYLFD